MPTPPPRAVIDLGTNTFHLLIARIFENGTLEEIYRERKFVKLAAEGIENIGRESFERGLLTMNHFKKILDDYNCESVTAIGTAALRRAANGDDFIKQVAEQTSIHIRLISGDEEARLITNGVLRALPLIEERLLIMDIGGGSTEYIITEKNTLRWRQSFPIGISVLYKTFHRSEPISVVEQRELLTFLEEATAPLAAALKKFPTHHLTGAAGNFDVLLTMLADKSKEGYSTSQPLDFSEFPAILNMIVSSSASERERIPHLPAERVDMIVVAMLLIDFTIKLANIERVTVSQYALKEGILFDEE